MSAGNNPDPNSLTDAGENGINVLSGDLGIHMVNHSIPNVKACLFGVNGSGTGCVLGASLDSPSILADYRQVVAVKKATALPDLGPMTANAGGALPMTLRNVHLANLPFRTNHYFDLDTTDANGNLTGLGTSDFYLSLQSQNVTWSKISQESAGASNIFKYTDVTGAYSNAVAAQKGWWISIPTLTLKDMVSPQYVYLNALGAVAGAIFNTRVDMDPFDLGQKAVDNCYGTKTFC